MRTEWQTERQSHKCHPHKSQPNRAFVQAAKFEEKQLQEGYQEKTTSIDGSAINWQSQSGTQQRSLAYIIVHSL